MNKKLLTGCKGEKLATEYLVKKGYKILENNWRSGHKEVDIIAMDNDVLVIVEVKTRKYGSGLSYADVLTLSKQNNLIDAAETYSEEKSIEAEIRFDLVFISLQGDSFIVDHVENAFNTEI
jgi:putative endonuclease